MELEGLKRCLQNLKEDNITVSDITTDRHPQVKKFIREKQPEVRHWFDVWHVSKGIFTLYEQLWLFGNKMNMSGCNVQIQTSLIMIHWCINYTSM